MALPARRKFTVSDLERMVRAGLILEDERVELIGGEIVEMSPIGPRHAASVTRTAEAFSSRIFASAGLAGMLVVQVQNPIELGTDGLLQPDVAIVRRESLGPERHPRAGDALLVVEVSDTSLEYDTTVKLGLYAWAEIPEVWIEDLEHERVLRYSQPRDGSYRLTCEFRQGEVVESDTLRWLRVEVSNVMG